MKNSIEKIIVRGSGIVANIGLLLGPAVAFAQTTSAGSNTPTTPITSVEALVGLMCTIFGWMFYGLIVLALIMIVIAGFNYTTAGDNAEKVSKANKMILYSAIAIAVALMAKGLPLIVGNFLGATGPSLKAC